MLPTLKPDANPCLNDAGTHTASARLAVIDGVLHQAWLPVDWNANDVEWLPVPVIDRVADTPPVW